jgi:hypothetical protein
MSGWRRRGWAHEGRLPARVVSENPDPRQVSVLAAYVAAGGSVADAAKLAGIRPSTAKRHLADLRARSGLTTEQLIYRGRAEGWLVVAELEPGPDREDPAALWRPSSTRSSPYSNSSP